MEENFDLNESADNSAETKSQTGATETAGKSGLELMSKEQLESLQNEAKSILKEIEAGTADACAQMEGLINRLNILKSIILEENKLAGAYGEWFSMLIRENSPSNEYNRLPEITDDTLIRLSRDLSSQKCVLENRQTEVSALDAELAAKKKELAELNRRIESGFEQKKQEKEAELAELDGQIAARREELEDIQREIEAGNRPAPLDPDSRTVYEAAWIEEFDREGFALPENTIPTHIYLCGNVEDGCTGCTDITGDNNVGREALMEIDIDSPADLNKFRKMGKPQIVIRKVQTGKYKARSQSPHYPNKIDDVSLSCDEDIDVRQGAVIEMTDKYQKTQRVKVYIAI